MAAYTTFNPDRLASYYHRRPEDFSQHAFAALELYRMQSYQGHPHQPLRLPEGVFLQPGARPANGPCVAPGRQAP